jgi:hypothetical protein
MGSAHCSPSQNDIPGYHRGFSLDIIWDKYVRSGDALILLDDGIDIALVRSFCPDWNKVVRFREWFHSTVAPMFLAKNGQIREPAWEIGSAVERRRAVN